MTYQEIPEEEDLFDDDKASKKEVKKEKVISKKPKIYREPKKIEPKKIVKKTLTFVYPKSTLVKTIIINEGLRRTSLYREITREIYTSPDSRDVLENYYRNIYKDIQIMRVQTHDIFHILKMKFRPSKNRKIQIAYYSFGTYKSDRVIMRKYKLIKARLAKEIQTVKHYKKEINKLKALVEKGHTKLISRIADLKRRIVIASNSSSYWDLKALNLLCKERKNILLITQIKKR